MRTGRRAAEHLIAPLNPTDVGVVSVTELQTDGTRNVLPGHARILGDARSFSVKVSAVIEDELRRIAAGIAALHGIHAKVSYSREFVPLMNDAELTSAFAEAAQTVSGNVSKTAEPMTASEDFARFLDRVPGCFAFIGNGEDSAPLHSPSFDFNDYALLHGARLHVAVARHRLPVN